VPAYNLAADSKFGMAKAVFWCHFLNNFIGALFTRTLCTYSEKCAVMIALPHQTDIERKIAFFFFFTIENRVWKYKQAH
jgi:hypothetical protein